MLGTLRHYLFLIPQKFKYMRNLKSQEEIYANRFLTKY